ncbi:DUF3068 domain-containing protein [Rhodococcus sp. WB9]|uniref:porin PorA family protein n=1 Tax=Rhodococcus sp. WB9 TaxID=2594007 RepID=UPI0011867272|nr:porin PorA family protein [Rhodococcus sp. WB9]QDQ93027.1 DUF3068 domain-containing protein [Rhodococcus sp. WB9]
MISSLDVALNSGQGVVASTPFEGDVTRLFPVAAGLLWSKIFPCSIPLVLSEESSMAMRRSSVVLLIVGVLLIAAAAAIKYVAVPNLSKLPEDTDENAAFEGTLRQLDPTSFALDAGTPITIDRSVTVDEVAGDTAVVTSTAVTHLPSGDTTDRHSYAISRVDYTQAPAPDGAQVENQQGGVTLSFPMNPTTDDTLVYDSVTRTAQPVTYTGTSTLEGRDVHSFTGTTTAPIADPAVLGPVKAGIAALAQSGDGSTLPKAMLQSLLPALPADRAAAVLRTLETAPEQVPVVFTSVNAMTLAVDTRFGAPINTAQNQTTVLNIQSGDATVPLLDLSQVQVETSEASIQSVAQKFVEGERQLNILAVWVPLASALMGLLLVVVAIVRRKPGAHGDDATGVFDPSENDPHAYGARTGR